MKKLDNVFQIDSFTTSPFEGNPAGVVMNDSLSEIEMQKIAKEMNLSETAFLQKSDKADYLLRWFTPTVEVDLCGHATIASIHYLAEMNLLKNNSDVSFSTRSGILHCRREDDLYFMQIPVQGLMKYESNKKEILNALNLPEDSSTRKYPFVLTADGILYINIDSFSNLKKIKPDFDKVYKLTENHNEIKVVTVYTTESIDKDSSAHLRFFAPYYGINEDPVTGSANGPLLMVLRYLEILKNSDEKLITFEQGDIIGRKGRVKVIYSPTSNLLRIAGNAVTVFKGELYL
jgi:PhzF family phenazine biosynthesis protein